MEMNLHTFPEYLKHVYLCFGTSFWSILSHCFLETEMEDANGSWQFPPLLFFFFLLPRCLEQKGVEWMGEWSSDSL